MIIADTNVVSELMLPVASQRVQAWVTEQRKKDEVWLTAINVAEIVYSVELLPKGKRRDDVLLAAEAMPRNGICGSNSVIRCACGACIRGNCRCATINGPSHF